MTFDPLELYRFANWLDHNKPTKPFPVVFRAIVSRAYYSTLLIARDKHGLTTKGRGGHRKVIDFYKSSPNLDEQVVGMQIEALKVEREEADYDCNKDIGERESEKALERARDILLLIGAIDSDDQGFTIPMT